MRKYVKEIKRNEINYEIEYFIEKINQQKLFDRFQKENMR